jgi:hypothetical protein
MDARSDSLCFVIIQEVMYARLQEFTASTPRDEGFEFDELGKHARVHECHTFSVCLGAPSYSGRAVSYMFWIYLLHHSTDHHAHSNDARHKV